MRDLACLLGIEISGMAAGTVLLLKLCDVFVWISAPRGFGILLVAPSVRCDAVRVKRTDPVVVSMFSHDAVAVVYGCVAIYLWVAAAVAMTAFLYAQEIPQANAISIYRDKAHFLSCT